MLSMYMTKWLKAYGLKEKTLREIINQVFIIMCMKIIFFKNLNKNIRIYMKMLSEVGF